MFKAETYYRKSDLVEAVRVTEENILQVAEACGGDYSDEPNSFAIDRNKPVPHISLTTAMAFVGDWVVKISDSAWRVYGDVEFKKKFWTHSERLVKNEEYARVYQLVIAGLITQDKATYAGEASDMNWIATRITKQILRQQ